MGSRGREDVGQGGRPHGWGCGWLTEQSHICTQISSEEQQGSETMELRVSEWETKDSKPLAIKTFEGCGCGRNSTCHRRLHWRGPQGPRMYISQPTWESAPRAQSPVGSTLGADTGNQDAHRIDGSSVTKWRNKRRLPKVKSRKINREPTVKGRKLEHKAMIWNKRKQ